jgi:hypothetical protein
LSQWPQLIFFSLGVVTSTLIANSLLRLDGVANSPPYPFERLRADMDFAVLELNSSDDLAVWCRRTMQLLTEHADLLHRMRSAGAKLTLFVEPGSHVLRFEPSFLQALAEAGVALEYSHANT